MNAEIVSVMIVWDKAGTVGFTNEGSFKLMVNYTAT